MFIAASFVALSLISSVSTPRAPSSAAVGALRKHVSTSTKALHYPDLHGSRQPGCLFSAREQEVASSRNASNSVCFATNKPRQLQSGILRSSARKVASPMFSYQSRNASNHEFARFQNHLPAKVTSRELFRVPQRSPTCSITTMLLYTKPLTLRHGQLARLWTKSSASSEKGLAFSTLL
jgi:hypothetical protein